MESLQGPPSSRLARYISDVEAATGRKATISHIQDASDADELQAALNLGPSIQGIEIKFRPPWPLQHQAVEKSVAHELTHALMIYGMGYPIVSASDEVPTEQVQKAADVPDFIDDVIVDVKIQERGFPAMTPEHLQPYLNITRILETARRRDQIFDPKRDDKMATEIKFFGDYIYCWALPRYYEVGRANRRSFQSIYSTFSPDNEGGTRQGQRG